MKKYFVKYYRLIGERAFLRYIWKSLDTSGMCLIFSYVSNWIGGDSYSGYNYLFITSQKMRFCNHKSERSFYFSTLVAK